MNKIACDVIKDLLPLYVDDVCSEKTKDLIKAHLAECEDCLKYYESLQEGLPEVVISSKTESWDSFTREKEFITKVSKKIAQKATLKGVVISFLCFILIMCLITSSSSLTANPFQFIPFLDHRLEVEDIHVTEIYELDNGDIYFTLWSDEKINWSHMTGLDYDKYLEEDTKYFASAQLTYTWWSEYIEHVAALHSVSFVYQTEQIGYNPTGEEGTFDISSIYYIGKNDERLTIWEKGQNIEKAPEEIEYRVASERYDSDYDRQGFVLYNWDSVQNLY